MTYLNNSNVQISARITELIYEFNGQFWIFRSVKKPNWEARTIEITMIHAQTMREIEFVIPIVQSQPSGWLIDEDRFDEEQILKQVANPIFNDADVTRLDVSYHQSNLSLLKSLRGGVGFWVVERPASGGQFFSGGDRTDLDGGHMSYMLIVTEDGKAMPLLTFFLLVGIAYLVECKIQKEDDLPLYHPQNEDPIGTYDGLEVWLQENFGVQFLGFRSMFNWDWNPFRISLAAKQGQRIQMIRRSDLLQTDLRLGHRLSSTGPEWMVSLGPWVTSVYLLLREAGYSEDQIPDQFEGLVKALKEVYPESEVEVFELPDKPEIQVGDKVQVRYDGFDYKNRKAIIAEGTFEVIFVEYSTLHQCWVVTVEKPSVNDRTTPTRLVFHDQEDWGYCDEYIEARKNGFDGAAIKP